MKKLLGKKDNLKDFNVLEGSSRFLKKNMQQICEENKIIGEGKPQIWNKAERKSFKFVSRKKVYGKIRCKIFKCKLFEDKQTCFRFKKKKNSKFKRP